jgi:hypothetical protein
MRLLTVLSSSLILGGLLLAGCGDDGPSGPPEHGPLHACEGDYVCPAVAYTGYDGRNYFKVPFSTNLKNPTWSVADPSLASLYKVNAPVGYEEFGATWIMLETFAPGTTKVIATEGGKTLEATVIIADYDPDVVAVGKQRYNYSSGTGAERATCASCHQAVNGADHSSLEMAAFDDAEILKAIVEGAYSDGYVLDSGVEGQPHEWNLTAEETPAIVPYLRSLAPTKFFKR